MEEEVLAAGKVGAVQNENEEQLEEVGTVDKIIFSSQCFVFAQSWPSWSYTLRSMGCSDLVTAVVGVV